MAPRKMTFYVDIVSPFAYQAYYIIRNDPVFKNVDVTYIPVFLGGIIQASNNKTPIDIKNKFPYINKQRARFAKQFNIPIHKAGAPPNFPAMTLYVQRILAALTIIEPSQDVLVKAVDALYKAYWVEHTDVSKPENHLRVIAGAVGEDLCKKAAELAPKEGKALVLKNSEQAFNDGAFGLPWMYCTDSKGEKEGFWGVDQMGQVCEFLEIDRPKQGGWKAVL